MIAMFLAQCVGDCEPELRAGVRAQPGLEPLSGTETTTPIEIR